MNKKVEELLDCARAILYDECPARPEHYLCRESECYDESACTRCWDNYLFKVVNGEV